MGGALGLDASPGRARAAGIAAVALHAAGQPDEAIASLLDLVVDFVLTSDAERYTPAISGSAAYIRSLESPEPCRQ